MGQQGLEDVLRAAGNPVTMLRNSQIGAYVYPVVPAGISPTGATNSAPGATAACCSTSRTTWPSCSSKGPTR